MRLIQDVISESEIQTFKQYFQTHYDRKYTNWVQRDQTIDDRLIINERHPEFDTVKRIVSKDFENPAQIWAAYQRQSRPHNIHIDDYGAENKNYFRYTYIVAMDNVPEFKTIIWKEKFWDNNEFHEFIIDWGRTRRFRRPVCNISATQDLEHTYDVNQEAYMSDYLTLDDVYTYQTGTACLFDCRQLHCSSNWPKYNKFLYRDLLTIHVLSEVEVAC